jgi:hypothetical protein
MGRPSSFTQETADAICQRIADGESLRSVCSDEGMPHKSVVMRWLGDNPAFQDQYARAREAQADAIFDEILDIVDDGRNDWMERQGDDGGDAGWRVNGEHIQRAKLRVDARKWMAGKLQPKKYGERVTQEHVGANGGPIETADKTDPVALARRVAFLLASGAAKVDA